MRRHGIADYPSLLARALDTEWFWNAVLEDLGIRFDAPYSSVVDMLEGIERPQWCVGGELNIVNSCLDKWRGTPTWAQNALVWESEDGATRRFNVEGKDRLWQIIGTSPKMTASGGVTTVRVALSCVIAGAGKALHSKLNN